MSFDIQKCIEGCVARNYPPYAFGQLFESYTVHMVTLIQYFFWHYVDVPKGLLRAWRNFLKFGINYFSIPLLAKTLFYPWRRYSWSYGRGFDIGNYIYVFFSNSFSRIMGAIMRIFLIIVGAVFEAFILLFGPLVIFGWLLLPAVLVFSLMLGLWFIL